MAKSIRAELRKILGDETSEETINSIIALHLSVVDPLKDDLQTAKEAAEKLPTVQKELDDLKDANKDGDDWKSKYDALVAENAKNAEKTAKTDALRGVLKDIGIADKRLETVLKCTDLDSVKLDKDGKIENADDLKKSLKTEWSDFITTRETHGANTANPPVTGAVKTYKDKNEILAIRDTAERQKAIAENHEMFGI